MTPLLLRKLWSLVERTHPGVLLNLDDESLVQWLLRHLRSELFLDHTETDALLRYINSHVTLIRDLAEAR